MRILLKPVVDFPLENLILAESTQFRSSQLTRSGGTLAVIARKLHKINYFVMKKYQISILFSLVCICGIVFQNYRLAEMFNKSRGKNRALFGITELIQLDVKLYLGIVLVVSLVFGILAIRKAENKQLSILSIILSVIGIILLFIRLWPMMV